MSVNSFLLHYNYLGISLETPMFRLNSFLIFGQKLIKRGGCNKNFLVYIFKKKSQTCEEGRVHLGISFWHLLMNLKNK